MGFFRSVKIIHMGPGFLLCHDANFYFISYASDESEYAMQKINMDNYRVTSWRGFRIFKPAEPDFSAVYSLGAPSNPEDGSPDD
jgi:hypothetical protein